MKLKLIFPELNNNWHTIFSRGNGSGWRYVDAYAARKYCAVCSYVILYCYDLTCICALNESSMDTCECIFQLLCVDQGLQPLYAPIRHKLATALTNWHPSDPSARLILQPWCSVFRPGHMDAFLIKNILPKLVLCLQEFNINPSQQQLGLFW